MGERLPYKQEVVCSNHTPPIASEQGLSVPEAGAQGDSPNEDRTGMLPASEYPGYIYFFGADHGPIKIGYAKNVRERLSKVQTSHWEKLHVYGQHPGDMRVEKRIHELLKNYRIRGEWFDRDIALELNCDLQIEWLLREPREMAGKL